MSDTDGKKPLGLGGGRRALAQRDRHVLAAAVAEVLRMRVALAAVADHGDLLALDQADVGITVVINAHGFPFPEAALIELV